MNIEIKNTKDYSRFIQRENVGKRVVNELLKEVKRDNYLHYCPIVVSRDMVILDGHKRFLVSKELESPIYYVVREDISCGGTKAIDLMDNDKWYTEWSNLWEDEKIKNTFLSQKDNENYKELAEFLNKLGCEHNSDLLRKCYIIFSSMGCNRNVDFHNGLLVKDNFSWSKIGRILDISGMTIENRKPNTFTDNMLGGTIRFLKHHPNFSIEKVGIWWKTAKPTLVKKCGVQAVANLSWERIETLMVQELL